MMEKLQVGAPVPASVSVKPPSSTAEGEELNPIA